MTTETAPADRITLPGGEMLAWSDLPQERLAHGGPLAALAVRLVPPGARVLLAGPHDPALLDQLRHAEVTCLLRSHPDAVALADRAAHLVVGGVAGLPDETYDVVIAAAGLDPVESVEGTPLGWDAVLARLVAAVRPGGALLLRLDNPLGLHRLVDTTPWYARRDDSAWTIGGVLDRAHPTNRDHLRERLTTAGLRPVACWAAYPDASTPTALLDADHLDRDAGSGLFDAVLHGACAGGFASATVLQDPARLAVDALHAGRAADLAPGWLTLARRPADPTPSSADGDLPVALVQTGRPGIGVLEVLHGPSGPRWGLTAVTGVDAPVVAPFASREAAYRDPDALSGPVPSGRLLRTLLLDAAVRRDLAALRTLLHGYAGWLADQADADGRIAGAAALAGTDNVVVDGERYAVLDPSWRATAALPADVVLARGLWRFATGLLTGGYAHPWPSTLDVAGLTVVLAGVAGHDLDRATVTEAVETEAAIAAALHGLDPDGRIDLAAELHAVTPTDPPVGAQSYQQLREAWLRQREELTRLAALTAWTEELLTSRERALRRAETTIGLLSGSISYRVGRLAITPARLAKRGARAAKRRATAVLAPKREEQQ
ncbi:class I SAM-dependent methyltransferase [Micromonospora sp. WMMD1120]|uniref:class I SAM-dependent methyltransferase n=1 Tax=Micromonospora sp. WMMD1120 TaxID=3016106 RepID=UPI00241673EF|nr:class I SAM-dependent methyltransferase [Micromonospora sp. WMMD1120]MDG4808974.1 class I SAM-dependent methyltransferase [Micromonospora sp. WMMD1120]